MSRRTLTGLRQSYFAALSKRVPAIAAVNALIVHRPEPTSDHGTTLALWHNVVRRGEANAGMPPVLRPSSYFKLVR